MEVFVVTCKEYDCGNDDPEVVVVKVFTTDSAAKAYCSKQNLIEPYYYSYHKINVED